VTDNKTRDAFLARVAGKLDAQAAHAWSLALKELADGSELRAAIAELVDFARELRIIATPDEPIPLQKREVDLALLITNLFNERRSASAQTEIAINASDLSVIGQYDAQHVATMVLELTSNALKYSPPGCPVTITIQIDGALVVENRGAWVGDRVSFERFARGEIREDVPGYGVGLWLTQRLAEAHEGSLKISSAEGVTRAIISLPFTHRSGDAASFSIRLLKPVV
jgi:signal transduction histidine kinase